MEILAEEKRTEPEKEILREALRFQLYWWKSYTVTHFKLDKDYSITKENQWLKKYFTLISETKLCQNSEKIKQMIKEILLQL